MSPRKTFGKPGQVPLLYALLAPFVALTIITVGLVGYISFRNGRQAVNNVADRLRGEITRRIEDHLDRFLTIPHHITKLNAEAIRRGRLDPRDPEALMKNFWDQVGIFQNITSVYFGNPQGGLVNSGREGAGGARYFMATDNFSKGPLVKYAADDQGRRTDVLFRIPEYDASSRQWYTGAAAKGDAVWSPVYILSTGQDMAIAASRPVYDDRKNLLGVVSVDIFLSHISHFLRQLEIGQTGQAFIIERSGLLIASSTEESPLVEITDSNVRRRLNAAQSGVPLISRSVEAMIRRLGNVREISQDEHLEFEIDGQRQYLQVAPMKNEHGLDWLILVVIPEADFMAQIKTNNLVTGLFIAAAAIVALLVGFLAAQRITRPILNLNQAAQSLAEGGHAQAIPDRTWLQELSELTRSFNRMSAQLQQTLEKLMRENAERRQVEEALRTASGRLQGVLDHSPLMISEMSLDGRYLMVNRAICDMFGAEPEDLIGKAFSDLLPRETADRFVARLKRIQETNQPLTVDDRLTIDGRDRIYNTVLFPLLNADGRTSTVGGIANDVTQRTQAQEMLRDSEERLALALKGADLGTWDWWPQNGRLIFDGRWAEMLGYGPGELEPHIRAWRELIHPDDAAMVRAELERHLNGLSDLYETVYRLAHKSGGWVWVLDKGKVTERDAEGRGRAGLRHAPGHFGEKAGRRGKGKTPVATQSRAENGIRGHPGRRRGSRFQQSAPGHHRPHPDAAFGRRSAKPGLSQPAVHPGRGRPGGQPGAPASALQPQDGHGKNAPGP